MNIKKETFYNTNGNNEIANNPAKDLANKMLDEMRANLSNKKVLHKEYIDLKNDLEINLFDVGIFYRLFAKWNALYEENKKTYTEEQINDITVEIFNIMSESVVFADYVYGLFKKNSLLYPENNNTFEYESKVNFAINLLFEIMVDYFGVENPSEKYKEIYNQVLKEKF